MIFEARYDRFLTACQDIQRHREKLARPAIEAQLLAEVTPETPNDALLAHVIAEALLRRIDRTLVESKNIYLQKFDISQIDLFYMMCAAYPQVPQGHAVANQLLAHELRQHRRAALLEIGIGKGRQVAALLDALTSEPGALHDLTVIALEPSRENIDEAFAALEARRLALPFELTLRGVNKLIEQCTPGDLAQIAEAAPGALAVNSAYAMHHVVHRPGDTVARTEIVRRIASMGPRLFTLVEPNANHDTEQLTRRFHACWEHFGTVFDLIDEAARDVDAAGRFTIKEKFFGREIRDIFGTSDAFRCERHEPFESWLLRLAKAGLRPYPRAPLEVSLPAYATAQQADGLVRMGYRDQPLVAVFAYESPGARPARRRASSAPPAMRRASSAPPAMRGAAAATTTTVFGEGHEQ